jgi:hypothetical protein
MYDHLLLKAEAKSLGVENLIIECKDYAFEMTIQSKDDVITSLHFWHRNLNVTIKKDQLIVFGSLCKYFYGNNQQTLTITDTEKAIEQLSIELNLPIAKFQVMTLEVGTNIITEHPPQYYFQFLGPLSGKDHYPPKRGTYYYNNSNQEIIFYDKVNELNRNGIERLPDFKDKNILRFEVKYKKRLATQFRRSKILVEDLYSKDFYKMAVEDWRNTYNKIYKHKIQSFSPEVFKSVKILKSQLMLLGILSLGGESTVLKIIGQEHHKKAFKYTAQRTRIVNVIKALLNTPNLTMQSDGILELDRKVDAYANEQISTLALFRSEAS